jgi:hypothetical protein
MFYSNDQQVQRAKKIWNKAQGDGHFHAEKPERG